MLLSKSKSKQVIRLGVSPGEPAGIGPDICIQAFSTGAIHSDTVFYGDPQLFAERAQLLGIELTIEVASGRSSNPNAMNVHPIELIAPCVPGKMDPRNANYVIACLQAGLDACVTGSRSALVTGPVNKAIINEAGIDFSGHTEWLAEQTQTKRVVMMLASNHLRVALATTHLPLAEVPTAITTDLLKETISIIISELRHKFGIVQPRLLVCGLNPHAGENGYLGREEIEIIEPVVRIFKQQGIKVNGPVPADTAFTEHMLNDTDAVLAMYHDQGLPVIKHRDFGDTVNITLGLPIIRTSVDHGTALDLAGTGNANATSLISAIRMAEVLVQRQFV